ncbi:MAG: aldehyde dehydrogenase family protein [Halarcobacter sp.]
MIELKHFINGEYTKKEENFRNIYNPSKQEDIGTTPIASEEEILDTIKCANEALKQWSNTPSEKRAEYLYKIAQGLEKRKDDIAKNITLCMGKPLKEALLDVEDAIACYSYYAESSKDIDAENQKIVSLEDTDYNISKRYEPVGVVGLIVPWNFPTVTTAWKVAPALAAGCTVILKPSGVSPIPEHILAEISKEIDLPNGVLNILYGGANLAQELTKSEDIAKISFTGSTRVGQELTCISAPSLKNLSLELGGKSALIACEDANIDEVATLACNGIFFNNGQMCSATSRVLIHKNIYTKVLEKLKQKVEELKIGDPLSMETDIGPLSSKKQFNTVCNYFEIAKEEKLTCLTGGKKLDGNYVSPTIYYDVFKTSRLWQEEIFGPILCVNPFDTIEEAIIMANDTEYGLAASVISKDQNQAISIANSLKAGIIWINTDQIVLPQLSWGGYKKSSIGRELGEEGLNSFRELKHIIMPKEKY